ncbi:MAG: CotH kinase family protein [Marinilabilia sp.]
MLLPSLLPGVSLLKGTLILMFFIPFGIDCYAQETQSDVIINEIMASNSDTFSDAEGDYPDWVELYNRGNEPVNLEGWGLSDDEDELFRWIFPDVTIEPGEYLIVWASNKDRRPDWDERSEGIVREVYEGIPGERVDDLLSYPGYPGDPDFREVVTTQFEAPVNVDDNYGQRMHGLLLAPQTGDYIFRISGDDNSRLFLSNDETPHNAELIAEVPLWTESREWDKYDEQQSEEITLTEGEFYYISALMKEGYGGDNLAVEWELPDGSKESPLDASHIFTVNEELHTNFAISSGGEPVILTDDHEEIRHYVEPVEIPADVSYGLENDDGPLVYFENPTPGELNQTTGYSEIITETPEFSETGGFYESSFELALTTDDPDAEIYYTLDGSLPDVDHLDGTSYEYVNSYPGGNKHYRESKSYKYDEPITIEQRDEESYELAEINTRFSESTQLPEDNIFKGTVVRARIVKEDAISSEAETHTFFVSPDGKSRYQLPVVSIVTDEGHLFDYEKGIYVPGKVADEWHASHPDEDWNDGRPANYNQRGNNWEKPAHFEYFDEDLEPALRQDIGVRIHGGWTRAYPMKSLRLYARKSYDEDNFFDYPFFGDLPSRGNPDRAVTEFRRLVLRNSGNDNFDTMYRDALMQHLVRHLPFAVQASQPVVHFIDGEFWGIINIRERFDEDYIAAHYDMDPDQVAILEPFGNVDEGNAEDRDRFLEVVDYAEQNNTDVDQHFEWLTRRVDTESLAQYYAAQIYFYNTDWPQNNMTFWRKRTDDLYLDAPRGHDGKWRWMLYDTDFGMNLYGDNEHAKNGIERVLNEDASDLSSRLFRQLLENQTFHDRFINIVADQLNSCFRADHIQNTINAFNETLEPHREEHRNRWRSGTGRGEAMKTFANHRPRYVINHMDDAFDLNGTAGLSISREGEGLVKVNSIIISKELPGIPVGETPYPWEGEYFRDVPVSLEAIDVPGYRFSHWEGDQVDDDNYEEREIRISLTDEAGVTAVFEEEDTDLIHYWHFNDLPGDDELDAQSPDQTLTEEEALISYAGESDGYMDRVNDGTGINLRDGAEEGRALRVRNPAENRELVFDLPTTGYEEIVMQYAVKRTTNGAQVEDVQYRTEEGGNWTSVKENIQIGPEYKSITIDLSKEEEVSDNPDFAVRILFPHESASGTSGNNRFDNVTLEGYAIRDTLENGEGDDLPVRIYPIPASDVIHVESAYVISRLSLFDINGKVVKQMRPGTRSHTTAVKQFRQGVYFLKVETSEGVATRKIVLE